jgi:hypothetical protein
MTAAELREKIHAARLQLDNVPLPSYLTADLGVDTLAAVWRLIEPDLETGGPKKGRTHQKTEERICKYCKVASQMRLNQRSCAQPKCRAARMKEYAKRRQGK